MRLPKSFIIPLPTVRHPGTRSVGWDRGNVDVMEGASPHSFRLRILANPLGMDLWHSASRAIVGGVSADAGNMYTSSENEESRVYC